MTRLECVLFMVALFLLVAWVASWDWDTLGPAWDGFWRRFDKRVS